MENDRWKDGSLTTENMVKLDWNRNQLGRKPILTKHQYELKNGLLKSETIKSNVLIHLNTISKIIKSEGLTRKYRTRKIKYNYVRIPLKKDELVEIDVKFVPDRIDGRRYYQFTAIDCASRWRYMQAYYNIDNVSAIAFLKELISVANFKIMAVKTDNGSCFTNRYNGYYKSDLPFPRPHAFDVVCNGFGMQHYLIDPGKPQQNAFVERSHRTDQLKIMEYGLQRYKALRT